MFKKKSDKKTVFVGLSGGVDSSVAALRLLCAGYNVVGVFIKVWQPDFLKCDWEEERLDAMRAAAHLGIPFMTFDGEEAYRTKVGEYFVNEYKEGRTPNPDVMCNQFVKFGVFLDFALANGADFVATGHYVRKENIKNKTEKTVMLRGLDMNKDQSYFLWAVTKDRLEKILFPVGDTEKEEIRKEAGEAGLPTATKKDSQGVCFLGHIDIPEFLSHFIDLKEGDVLNEKGDVVGKHKGALVYTLGQRHGYSVHTSTEKEAPHYVVDRNIKNNTITISPNPPIVATNTEIQLHSVNWINEPLSENIEVQFRYRQKPLKARVQKTEKTEASVILQESTDKPASGQSCVFYDGDECLGGGIVK